MNSSNSTHFETLQHMCMCTTFTHFRSGVSICSGTRLVGLSRNTDFLRWIRQIRHILKLCNICVCAQLLHILDLDVHFVLELVCETSWHMRDVDSFTNAQIQHGLTQGRESSNCSRQIAVCHMVTSWHDDDRHLRLYVEMQSEDSHVRASRVRVVAIGRGRE